MRISASKIVAALTLAGALTVSASPAAAQSDRQPPTEERSEKLRQLDQSDDFLSLFDDAGLPMLNVSAPTYLHLPNRQKLRAGNNNPGNNDGGGGGNDPGGPGDDPGDDNAPPPIDPPDPKQVPEPATMLMLVPAAVLAVRRYNRGKSSR